MCIWSLHRWLLAKLIIALTGRKRSRMVWCARVQWSRTRTRTHTQQHRCAHYLANNKAALPAVVLAVYQGKLVVAPGCHARRFVARYAMQLSKCPNGAQWNQPTLAKVTTTKKDHTQRCPTMLGIPRCLHSTLCMLFARGPTAICMLGASGPTADSTARTPCHYEMKPCCHDTGHAS